MTPVPRRILVVDDDPSFWIDLKRRLKDKGYVMTVVESPFKAIELLIKKNSRFDLIVLDMFMDFRDRVGSSNDNKKMGLSFFVHLRQFNLVSYDVPVLFTTAHISAEDCVNCMKSGAYSYIAKASSIDPDFDVKFMESLDELFGSGSGRQAVAITQPLIKQLKKKFGRGLVAFAFKSDTARRAGLVDEKKTEFFHGLDERNLFSKIWNKNPEIFEHELGLVNLGE